MKNFVKIGLSVVALFAALTIGARTQTPPKYAFIGETSYAYSGGVVTVTPLSGATHYESLGWSGGGAGGSVTVASNVNGLAGGAAASGGGSPGRCRNRLRAITSPLTIYVGRGGQQQTLNSTYTPGSNGIDPTYEGLPGEDTWIKENGVVVLLSEHALGGHGMTSNALSVGNNIEGSAGGNHENFVGDECASGESGYPGLLYSNVRVMGGGGSSFLSGGGKSSTSAGPGHGPGGGAMSYGGYGPYQGAPGLDGLVTFRWYSQL